MKISSNKLKNISKIVLYLPHEYFEDNEESNLFIFENKKYFRIELDKDEYPTLSFSSNRIKYDSEWYNDFVLELI